VIPLNCFSLECYLEAIKVAEDAGMECIIIDSITHFWDRLLDENEATSKRMYGNSFRARAESTPKYEKFKNAILQSSAHVITTVRRKTEYAIEKDDATGKATPKKIGLKEQTRDGWSYELTVNLQIDQFHLATADKDRTGLFVDKEPFLITEETGKLIKERCDSGVAPTPEAKPEEVKADKEVVKETATTPAPAKTITKKTVLNEKNIDAVVAKIKSGAATIEDVIEKMEASDQMAELLITKLN